MIFTLFKKFPVVDEKSPVFHIPFKVIKCFIKL